MKFTFFSLTLIILTSSANAMKRSHERMVLYPKIPTQKFIFYTSLPKEIQKLIITFCTHRSIMKKPRTATRTIAAFALTCKEYNVLINEPQFNDKLINDLAYRFYCSHETISKFLNTVESQRKLTLQRKLKKLCYSYQNNTSALEELIKEGVDLEFTYNHKSRQTTPLMLCIYYRNPMFTYLLKTNININTATPHGLTALQFSTDTSPLHYFHCRRLCEQSHININQQNNRGETALLRCLIKRKGYFINEAFIGTIQGLLKRGSDPTLGDKNGLTPLIATKQLHNNQLIQLIEQAIKDKHESCL